MSSVSDDDDSGPSLKELVTKNLEANGLLGKLQAQLRASVFLILEEEFQEKNIPILNEMTSNRLNCDVGKIAVSIIQDFLQSLKLEFTLAVFVPETKSLLTEKTLNRQYLAKKLGRTWKENDPVLFQLIEESRQSENKGITSEPVVSNADNRVILSTNSSCNENSTSEHTSTKSEERINQETSAQRVISNANDTTQPKIASDLPETKEVSVKKISKSERQESLENANVSNDISVHSTTSSKTLSSSSSSQTHSVSKNDTLNPSNLSNNQKAAEKDVLSGMEKEYEEEFSSLSENQHPSTEDSSTPKSKAKKNAEDKKKDDQSEEKTIERESDIEEEVETAEDIEEDISSLDDLLSSNSEISNQTKDITASKENTAPDYDETL